MVCFSALESVESTLQEAAHTGAAVDGPVAIEPVDHIVRMRDRPTIENGEG